MHRFAGFGNLIHALRLAALLVAVPVAGTLAQGPARQDAIVLKPGLVITASTRIARRTYKLTAPASLDSALITIRGSDITLDFAGATLEGIAPDADPDLAQGVAVRVEGGRNVRVINAHIRGFKVAILARGTRGLTLVANDVSYNWKPRLFSRVEHESLVDWLSFHHNEKDEWLRFGAAIYLADVHGGEFRDNTAVQGMNGLLLVRSDSLRILDNDFSFNSGLGVGLYRSRWNTIAHNRIEYNVRGYSHGFYRRGQDSAGLLMYEQSMGNVVAYNSVTHGGDGLFLWAGQSTMDTGAGGANDNLFFGNDFSFAPTNAMEATFSRNMFIANRAEGSDYGLWGGYSYNSAVVGNCFVGNRIVIAIEHGQENRITGNIFAGDSMVVKLWADTIQPSDWGYPKHRDTRNRDNRVDGNTITPTRDETGERRRGPARDPCAGVPPLPREFAAFTPKLPTALRTLPSSPIARRDRSAIIVDEWGPYDWKSPKLWPVDSSRALPLRLAVLGPAGKWRIAARRGVKLVSSESGNIGDTITVTPSPEFADDWELLLEYRGTTTVSPRGARLAARAPYRFSYARFEPSMEWVTRFFAWSDTTDPRGNGETFISLLGTTPLLVRTERRLDYQWFRPTIKGLPSEHFAVDATATVTLEPGQYTLRTISDDAIRVWVDGVMVIDNWTPHKSAVDVAPLGSGRHVLRVLHYQVDGWTELRVDIVRGAQRSLGSPGPH
jgi:parallel beta-helix repeat protein